MTILESVLLIVVLVVLVVGWFWMWLQLDVFTRRVTLLASRVDRLERKDDTRLMRETTPSWPDHHQP